MSFARLLACAVLLAACSKPDEPQAPSRDDAAYYPAPVAPAAPAAPKGPDPAVLARLEPVAASANADGAAYGLAFTAADFVSSYEHRLKELAAPFDPHDAKPAGLPEPEIVPFSPGEKGDRARWTESGGVRYGSSLPRDGSAVTEAWSRVYGFRDLSVTGMIITQSNVPADKWRRTLWQPNKKRWSYFTEDDERRILSAMVAGPLSAPKPDAKNSARFECERLQRAVDKARAEGREFEGYQRNMRGAIIRSFDSELKLLAANSLLERPF